MRIEGYGVVLDRPREEDLELLRSWRNDPEVSRFMRFRDTITPEMQRKWFDSIHPENDYYFVITFDGRKIGLADIKKIDWSERSAHGGIFVLPEYRNSDTPPRVSFCLKDHAFQVMKLEFFKATVLRSNTRAFRYNVALGYRALPGQPEDSEDIQMEVTREDYEAKTKRLREFIRKSENQNVRQ